MSDSDDEEAHQFSSASNSHPTTSSSNPPETDLSEETQDFRFLSSLTTTTSSISNPSSTTTTTTTVIPKRGEKDFEPNPTRSQGNALRASRQAMHDALSAGRVHTTKNWVVGYYTGRGAGRRATDKDADNDWDRRERGRDRDGRLRDCVVRIDQPRGTNFRTMGVSDRENRMWLLPEEALYSVERGSLDVRWGVPAAEGGSDKDAGDEDQSANKADDEDEAVKGNGDSDDDDDDDDDIVAPSLSDMPMSLQAAYATFISDDDLTLARYTVFAGLRRSGYTVIRAPTWWDDEDAAGSASASASTSMAKKQQQQQPDGNNTTTRSDSKSSTRTESASSHSPTFPQSLFHWPRLRTFLSQLFRSLFPFLRPFFPNPHNRDAAASRRLGPLVAPGLYRSYADIYRALTLIPFHDPTSPSSSTLPASASSSSSSSSSSTTAAPPHQQPQPPTPSQPSTTPLPPFRPSYHIYKPTTAYRKTSPPPPDFHLCIIDARLHPLIPTLPHQLGPLLDSMPVHDPRRHDEKLKHGRPEMRMKAGTRSVLLAVVDNGVVSFLRIGEVGSGRERVYEGREGVGGKRGGRGRGRGRGRAR